MTGGSVTGGSVTGGSVGVVPPGELMVTLLLFFCHSSPGTAHCTLALESVIRTTITWAKPQFYQVLWLWELCPWLQGEVTLTSSQPEMVMSGVL